MLNVRWKAGVTSELIALRDNWACVSANWTTEETEDAGLQLNSTTRAGPDQTKSADFVGDPGLVGSGLVGPV